MDADSPHSPSQDSQLAFAAIEASGNVIVSGDLPIDTLVRLAEAAARWGASMTLRNSRQIALADLKRVARAGRGDVTFDLS
jgi:ABC-type transporter Mla MlaB component